MKKSFDYYACLAQQADLAQQSVDQLCRGDIFALHKTQARLGTLAQESLQLRRALTDAVLEDFLPPLERTDLLALTRGIYRISHAAQAAVQGSFALPAPQQASDYMQQHKTLHACIALLPAIKKNSKELLSRARAIEDLCSNNAAAPVAAAFASLAAALEQAAVNNM